MRGRLPVRQLRDLRRLARLFMSDRYYSHVDSVLDLRVVAVVCCDTRLLCVCCVVCVSRPVLLKALGCFFVQNNFIRS